MGGPSALVGLFIASKRFIMAALSSALVLEGSLSLSDDFSGSVVFEAAGGV